MGLKNTDKQEVWQHQQQEEDGLEEIVDNSQQPEQPDIRHYNPKDGGIQNQLPKHQLKQQIPVLEEQHQFANYNGED
jgi:hypothetical protein